MNKPGPSPRDAERLHALAADLRVLLGRLRRRLREEAGGGELPPAQVDVVHQLEREGAATIARLARAQGMRPQSMGANVAALQAAGLVAGAPDPADGRQTLWSLTPRCVALLKAGRAAREDWIARALHDRFTAAEQAELARGVALLRRLADS
jgi:DNA-binding MarR family transcriptional regulator